MPSSNHLDLDESIVTGTENESEADNESETEDSEVETDSEDPNNTIKPKITNTDLSRQSTSGANKGNTPPSSDPAPAKGLSKNKSTNNHKINKDVKPHSSKKFYTKKRKNSVQILQQWQMQKHR